MSENPKSSEEQTEKKVPSTKKRFSVKEAEALGYYDFMSYLGVSYYHIGSLTSSKKLAELCQIDSTKKYGWSVVEPVFLPATSPEKSAVR